jgi:serine protease
MERKAAATTPDFELPDVQLPEHASVTGALRARYRTLLAARHVGRRVGSGFAEVNVVRHALRVPNDPLFDRQWHYPAISLEPAWTITTGGTTDRPPVVVAVVDTGVLLEHPDLSGQLLRDSTGRPVGFDFVQDAGRANDGDGIDSDPSDPGDNAHGPAQGSFHGTHVAGTVAADSNNGIGVAGVSWGARLMPLRALGVDGGTTFDVIQALRYAAGLSNVSGTMPPQRADIINLSLGSDFFSEAEQNTLNEARAQGVFVVASAGNNASNVPVYPASYDGVVSVSATTIEGASASYSNFGQHVDVAAPGGTRSNGVLSTLGEGGGGNINFGYGLLDGTSMATPHVAGVIALMKSVHPDLTPNEFDALLQSGQLTDDGGPTGRDDRFGWGIINANKAVQAALASRGGELGPIIAVSVGRLNFQAFTQELDFTVTRLGDGAVNVSVTENEPWLSVRPVAGSANPLSGPAGGHGFGRYRAVVDRSNLADGSYNGVIAVEPDRDDVDAQRIQVVMQVVSPDPEADAGQHYVILTPADSNESVAVQIATADNGEYTFALEDVPPGEYRLLAGTDLNDDDFICDGGEACGAFPTLSNPEIISVDGSQEPQVLDLTFASEFRTTVTTTSRNDTANASNDPAQGLRIDKQENAATESTQDQADE